MNQVAFLDIHSGIFSLDLNILFFEGVLVKKLCNNSEFT